MVRGNYQLSQLVWLVKGRYLKCFKDWSSADEHVLFLASLCHKRGKILLFFCNCNNTWTIVGHLVIACLDYQVFSWNKFGVFLRLLYLSMGLVEMEWKYFMIHWYFLSWKERHWYFGYYQVYWSIIVSRGDHFQQIMSLVSSNQRQLQLGYGGQGCVNRLILSLHLDCWCHNGSFLSQVVCDWMRRVGIVHKRLSRGFYLFQGTLSIWVYFGLTMALEKSSTILTHHDYGQIMLILFMSGKECCSYSVNVVMAQRYESLCKESMATKDLLLNGDNQGIIMGLEIILNFGFMVIWWMGLQGIFNPKLATSWEFFYLFF